MNRSIDLQIRVNASPATIWNYLTDHNLMTTWMGDLEMKVTVDTNWIAGQPIRICGFHHLPFENKGTVLLHEPPLQLSYSHLSSLSRLPDIPENYSVIHFQLLPQPTDTVLRIEISNFPTDAVYHHLKFYWQGIGGLLKKMIKEDQRT